MIFKIKESLALAITLSLTLTLSGCHGNDDNSGDDSAQPNEPAEPNQPTELDILLQTLIDQKNLDRSATVNRDIPSIESPLPNLGKKLFFSQSLGGNFDSACASCHHPALGGADELSLPIGVESINAQVLGQGRNNSEGIPFVPRNSPTIFNIALWDSSLFWDSRVESLGKEVDQNGAASGISTPDSGFGVTDNNAGSNLVVAQTRFPITSNHEMKTANFENGSSRDVIRHHLAARLGDYDEGAGELTRNQWLTEFQTAFNSDAEPEELVTFANIGKAISEYERSMLFINSPWRKYLNGDISALTAQQKQGALLFFNTPQDNGAGCSTCHSGPLLSDERHNIIAFPQIGIGKGDGSNGDDDFGRERVTGDAQDRYNFRTPSLLNVAVTSPYGHAGTFDSLERVLRHHINPTRSIDDYVNSNEWCQLAQFNNIANCADLYPNVKENGELALNKLNQERQDETSRLPNINLNNDEIEQLVTFLNSLTDPCVEDRDCLAPWIADETTDNPDDQVLIGTDINSSPL
ncbi:cytochrome-c peroxidase [Moritella viscosa]|uniref:Di-haem cytochrome c peroxidase n=1 Tax=Moritella viscosa TaxID=80854 RepID=A0ABY1HJH9_9GAMM|nr:cytochrome c peroxidase [Moritella viscosa]SGY96846.1 Di-haem cytochrome c peroxidase [Moritella viscosa]SGZ03128.1 Di-haem cytochrome c peroxidase [Moritella viscosa]SGZ03639.1 Di-haem cytochrome c peroxidase [Moritella viscosa]SGZ09733.1 Di-haem cytochrome c peroxidase [Moritella viscosa]SHO27363.1 Di-haem cytochrome c peroxidase [Moritella viscosa]